PCDHPHLHSFPTRRSSDLAQDEALARGAQASGSAWNQLAMGGGVRSGAAQNLAMQGNLGGQMGAQEASYAGNQNMLTAGIADQEDRKSTRLNSSHVKISYA